MATVTGFGTGFDPANFRAKIKQVMQMGLPQDATLRPTFKWTPARTFTKADANGNPWDFGATATSDTTHADVRIDCAVQFVPRATLAGGTALGHFDTPRAIITVLDVDYPSIVGASTVVLTGNTYNIDFVAPAVGLFSVTVMELHCSARDES